MKSALTRLTLLAGVSLTLCVSSVPGVALAAKPRNQPTSAQNQYIEVVPKVHGSKHTSGAAKRHKSTDTTTKGTTTKPSESTTTSTDAGETPSTPADEDTTPTVVDTVHHKTNKPGKAKAKPKSAASRRAHVLSSKPTHGAAPRLTAAAATGSGGGMGVWLLVILILVLVSGSAAGILRYRRNR